jgi:hypothetical protein
MAQAHLDPHLLEAVCADETSVSIEHRARLHWQANVARTRNETTILSSARLAVSARGQ